MFSAFFFEQSSPQRQLKERKKELCLSSMPLLLYNNLPSLPFRMTWNDFNMQGFLNIIFYTACLNMWGCSCVLTSTYDSTQRVLHTFESDGLNTWTKLEMEGIEEDLKTTGSRKALNTGLILVIIITTMTVSYYKEVNTTQDHLAMIPCSKLERKIHHNGRLGDDTWGSLLGNVARQQPLVPCTLTGWSRDDLHGSWEWQWPNVNWACV